jgi:hypothetical protein
MKESALRPADQRELDDLIELGFEMVGELTEFPDDADDAALVVSSIKRAVATVRAGAAPRHLNDAEKIAFALGAVWGDTARRALGWDLVMLEAEHGELLALVSPDRAYAIRPQLFIYRLLAQPNSDNTVALLLNMVVAGQVPPSAPKQYLVLE